VTDEKLGCKVYKEGVGLFVWAKLPEETSAEKFIDQILGKIYFITHQELEVMERIYSLCIM
jgi:DNA-binding transcriptional MocR family regulator